MEEIHVRLRSEFERLRLSVAEAARSAGLPDSQGLRDVLSGRKRLSAELLAQLVRALGVDALFVLTGMRGQVTTPTLKPDEQLLLDRYAAADEVGRKMAHRVLGPDPDQVPVTKVPRRGKKVA